MTTSNNVTSDTIYIDIFIFIKTEDVQLHFSPYRNIRFLMDFCLPEGVFNHLPFFIKIQEGVRELHNSPIFPTSCFLRVFFKFSSCFPSFLSYLIAFLLNLSWFSWHLLGWWGRTKRLEFVEKRNDSNRAVVLR